MTLEELAQILSFAGNYELMQLSMRVKVWVGLPTQPPPQRDEYRLGELLFAGLRFFCSGVP